MPRRLERQIFLRTRARSWTPTIRSAPASSAPPAASHKRSSSPDPGPLPFHLLRVRVAAFRPITAHSGEHDSDHGVAKGFRCGKKQGSAAGLTPHIVGEVSRRTAASPGATRYRHVITTRSKIDAILAKQLSPSIASATRRWLMRSSLSASVRVNSRGMCCTIITATPMLSGKWGMISASARGPPVDAAITITLVAAPAVSSASSRADANATSGEGLHSGHVHRSCRFQCRQQLLAHREEIDAHRSRRLPDKFHGAALERS